MSNFGSSYLKYINHLEQINDAALSDPAGMIRDVETTYLESLQNVAHSIALRHEKSRVAMLSGPSSSGKTTTAYMLRDCLEREGIHAMIISLDDFYLGSDRAPLLPDGSKDFETPHALDVSQVKACLQALVRQQEFAVPRFNFKTGQPDAQKVPVRLGERDFAIVEGIHALNPEFTAHLPAESLVKIYVSVKQMIKDVNGEVISPMDIRLVRRIVRDMRFRNTAPDATISMWANVERGENLYIRPYRISADYTVNSIHMYEPCIMRRLAVPILREIALDSTCYRKARDLEARLMRFEPIDPNLVPKNSMLREFIGPKQEESAI